MFEGQCVVVTGATRGLGKSCAQAFAAQGADVVLVARSSENLSQVEAEIRAAGGKARSVPCDVTRDDHIERLFGSLQRCDVLLNNAGTNKPQPFVDVDAGTLDMLLDLNVRSMFLVAQAAARIMVHQKSGVILNMSSQMGHVGSVDRTVYCMTKHAIEGLTKAMAVELAPLGVRVNAIAPTYIETPLTKPYFEDEEFRKRVLSSIPLGRIGRPEDVAAAAVFLASPGANLITGTSLLVDGGYTAR